MTAPSPQIDVRAPRFAAGLTSVVLAVALLTGSGWLVAAQALVFAVGAVAGLRAAPYGLLFTVTGAAAYLLGVPLLGAVATGLALVAALLDATTGACLGCELHLSLRRALPRTA